MVKVRLRAVFFFFGIALLVSFACFLELLHVRVVRAQDPVESVTVDGVSRTFVVHRPQGYNSKQRYPMVILLHGLNQDSDDMARLSHFNAMADRYGIIAVYPDALHRWNVGVALQEGEQGMGRRGMGGRGGGIRFPGGGYPGGGWPGRGGGQGPGQGQGQGQGQDQNQQQRPKPGDDLAFFNAMLDKISSEYSVDSARIYATGLSDGGFMDFRMACSMADRIAAIAPVGAEMPKYLFCAPGRAVPVLMINGTSDPIVSYGGGGSRAGSYLRLSAVESAKDWSRLDGCEDKPQGSTLKPSAKKGMETRVETYAGCHNDVTVMLESIVGGGNTWPGGEQFLDEKTIGKTSQDLNADEVIWKFFQAYHLPPSAPAAAVH
jgi:polyhydroxybutyrate depolymerase